MTPDEGEGGDDRRSWEADEPGTHASDDLTSPEASDDEPVSDPAADRPPGEGWYDEPPEGWDEDAERNVFGPTPGEGEETIEPGDPRLVHVLFVVLGVLVTLAVLADLAGLL